MSGKVVHEEDALREMMAAWSRADEAVHEAALRRFNLELTIDAQCVSRRRASPRSCGIRRSWNPCARCSLLTSLSGV